MKKIAVLLLTVLLTFAVLCGCETKEKTFTYDGLTITLDSSFRLTDDENHTVALVAKDMAVFALREDFSQQMNVDTLTTHDYAYLVLRNNHAEELEIKEKDGLTYFERDYQEDSQKFHYVTFCYKIETTFWMIQFACRAEEADAKRDMIFNAAETLSVTP